ncbi:RCC1 domain-containing protein, partial [Pseudomonas aeruginosa]|uniref:RCC1 domain-containing protein n=1 Tax=Pseudomonas aeruginosa TaxID=287 RepID=UPI002F946366
MQIGTASVVPVTVTGITTATAVAAGYEHTCALLADETIRCWGRDDAGELGDGNSGYGQHSTTPVAVKGIAGATAV